MSTTTSSPAPSVNDLAVRHLNQRQLAQRWHLSERTLERWRWRGVGPTYLKLNGRVCYRMSDILQWEQDHERSATPNKSRRDGKK